MQFIDREEERQRNEFEALKSIFSEDMIDLRDNSDLPLHLLLKLKPQQTCSGMTQAYAKIDLRVLCSKLYPNETPQIFLENTQGVSDAMVSELLNDLLLYTEKHRGDEIIYQLAQHIQEFLHKHNARPAGSFYEQMLDQQKSRQENELYKTKIQEDHKKQELRDEISKRKAILQIEEAVVDDAVSSEFPSNNDATYPMSSHECCKLPKNYECQLHRSAEELEIFSGRKIIRGCCLDHSQLDIITYIAIDLCTGEPLLLKEYSINVAPAFENRY